MILALLRVDNSFSGGNQYKIFECIRKDYGGKEIESLVSEGSIFTISDFTNSLNNPKGVGKEHSRHAVFGHGISKPMSLKRCKEFLLMLPDNRIKAKI